MSGLFPKKYNAVILAAVVILAGCASPGVNSTFLDLYRKDSCEKLNKSDEMFRRAIASASSDQATLVSNWKILSAAVNQARLEKHCSESGGVVAASGMPAAVRPKLGIQLAPVPASLTAALGLTSTSGALIVDVVKGLPADKAGIEKMDIVLGVNGKRLATPEEIISAIGQLGGNPRAEVQIWRNRSLKSYVVDLSSLPSNAAPLTADQTMEAAARDFDSGHYFDALKKYQKVVRQNPNDALAWYFIGQTLEKMHESAGAQAAYKRSLEIQPQGQVAESARQALANLSSSARPSAATRHEEEKWTKAARRAEAEKQSEVQREAQLRTAREAQAERDQKQAWQKLIDGAAAGQSDAMVRLGQAYESGDLAPQDPSQALEWYRKAAAIGNAQAMLALGRFHEYGMAGMDKSSDEALVWYRKAGEAGNVDAMYRAAKVLSNQPQGFFPGAKRKEIYDWTRKAAEAGHVLAMADMVPYFFAGLDPVTKDDAKALAWTRRAAEAGHVHSMYTYAECNLYGWWGSPKNRDEGLVWMRKAARSGDRDAVAYLKNSGLPLE